MFYPTSPARWPYMPLMHRRPSPICGGKPERSFLGVMAQAHRSGRKGGRGAIQKAAATNAPHPPAAFARPSEKGNSPRRSRREVHRSRAPVRGSARGCVCERRLSMARSASRSHRRPAAFALRVVPVVRPRRLSGRGEVVDVHLVNVGMSRRKASKLRPPMSAWSAGTWSSSRSVRRLSAAGARARNRKETSRCRLPLRGRHSVFPRSVSFSRIASAYSFIVSVLVYGRTFAKRSDGREQGVERASTVGDLGARLRTLCCITSRDDAAFAARSGAPMRTTKRNDCCGGCSFHNAPRDSATEMRVVAQRLRSRTEARGAAATVFWKFGVRLDTVEGNCT